MVKISGVEKASYAERAGLRENDILVAINGNEVRDVLDYRYYATEKKLKILFLRNGAENEVAVTKKDEYDELGLCFETYLMDEKQSCKNKCVFCFIDQNPRGMRESVYFKDDDSRLSFFFGNYVTLTNFNDRDVERIIKMRISPINISVHTTEPELRVMMMKNKNAGESLKYLQSFCDGGIAVNCQIVLCKGINDGEHLERTIGDLLKYDNVESIAVVPAGLTGHREGLYPLAPFSRDDAKKILRTVDSFGEKNIADGRARLVYASDEIYLTAGVEIPDAEYYEDYPQLENGVGMLRSTKEEMDDEICALCDEGFELCEKREVTLATGSAAYDFMVRQIEKMQEKWYNLSCRVIECKNRFFGGSVTVTGLLTGSDYLAALSNVKLGEEVLISKSSLRHEQDLFLDDMSLCELSQKLGAKITVTDCDGADIVRKILGI